MAANGRQRTPFRKREQQQFLHDAYDHLGPGRDSQLAEQSMQMRMDGVFGNADIRSNGVFLEVVEYSLNGFQFARGEIQGARNLRPCKFSEQGGASRRIVR